MISFKFFIMYLILLIPLSGFCNAMDEIKSPIIIKIAYNEKANSVKGKSIIRFKEMLEASFPNKIKVTLYENQKQYSEREELDAVEFGVINIIMPSTEKLIDVENIQIFQIFNIPFLFRSNNEILKLMSGSVGKDLINNFNKKENAIEAIGFNYKGFNYLIGKNFYIIPQDLKNKKIIISSLGMNKIYYNNLKMNITKANYEYSDLILSSIDNSYDLIAINMEDYDKFNLYKKFMYLTKIKVSYSMDLILVNKKWFNDLPVEIREKINILVKDMNQYSIDLIEKKDKIIMIKNINLTPKQEEEFKNYSMNSLTYFREKINETILSKTYKELNTLQEEKK